MSTAQQESESASYAHAGREEYTGSKKENLSKNSIIDRYCLDETLNNNNEGQTWVDGMPLPAPLPQELRRTSARPGAHPQAGRHRPIAALESGSTTDARIGTSRDDHQLVEARAVPSLDDLEIATPVDAACEKPEKSSVPEESKREQAWKLVCLFGLAAVLLLAAVLAGVALVQQGQKAANTSNAGPTKDSNPVFALLPVSTQSIILEDANKTQPQSLAYEWLLDDPELQSYSSARILQRFALATFYHSTDGPNWYYRGGETVTLTVYPKPGSSDPPFLRNITRQKWMSYTNECDWYSNAPPHITSICDDKNESIAVLELQGNGLSGELPEELGLLTSLERLNVRNNQIGGTIVTQLGRLSNLRDLMLNANNLVGQVPSEIGLLRSLESLHLPQNQLSGSLPSDLWKLSRLEAFLMLRNSITGTFPSNIGVLLPKLQDFKFSYTLLTGAIPASFGEITNLSRLDLGNSQISGPLPSELGRLGGLSMLQLGGNQDLSGAIPLEWGALNATLRSLGLDGAAITGTIPSSLCQVPDLTFDCSEVLCGCGPCTC